MKGCQSKRRRQLVQKTLLGDDEPGEAELSRQATTVVAWGCWCWELGEGSVKQTVGEQKEEWLGESLEGTGLETGRRAGRELRKLVIVCKTHTPHKSTLHMHSCPTAHDGTTWAISSRLPHRS